MADWSDHDPLAFVERFTNPLQDDMDRLYQRLAQNFQKIEDWAEHLFSIPHTHTESEITDFAHEASHRDGGSDELSLDNLASGASTALVATSQGTTSATFTDLATAGPEVTVTVGPSGLVQVSIYGNLSNANAASVGFMSFAVSGGNTLAADIDRSLQGDATAASNLRYGATFLLTALTPGSTTFTAKYRVLNAGNTATFADRRISVIPL